MTVAMTEAIAAATKAGMVVAKREGGGDGGCGDEYGGEGGGGDGCGDGGNDRCGDGGGDRSGDRTEAIARK